jgi:hypothetical protein
MGFLDHICDMLAAWDVFEYRYIAVEFAGIYSGMGAKVDLFYRKPYPLTYVNSNIRKKVMWVQFERTQNFVSGLLKPPF